MAEFGILDLAQSIIDAQGPDAVARQALERVSRTWWRLGPLRRGLAGPGADACGGFATPGRLRFDTAAALLGRLVSHPAARGLQVTIYDPSIDPSGDRASSLVELLERVLELRAGNTRKERST